MLFCFQKDFLLSVNNVLKEGIKPVWDNLQIKVSVFVAMYSHRQELSLFSCYNQCKRDLQNEFFETKVNIFS